MIPDSVLRLINDSLEGIGITGSQKDNVIRQIKMEAAKKSLCLTNRMTKAEFIDKIKGTKGTPELTKKYISLLS